MSGAAMVRRFVADNTLGCLSVLEFGAGRLDFASSVDRDVPWSGGIEIFAPYLEEPTHSPMSYVKIVGDMRDWRSLVPKDFRPDCAMFLDSLEHLGMEAAIGLVRDLQASFRKILLFIPIGTHVQTTDEWGYGNVCQTHLSTWGEDDVRALGFHGTVINNFHAGSTKGSEAAMFAIWEKN